MPERTAPIERRLLAATTVILLTVALTVQFGLNGRVLTGGQPVERAGYWVLAVIGLSSAVALLVRRRIPAALRWVGTAALLGCSVVVLPSDGGAEHWSIGLIGWYGLALLCEPAVGWAVGFLAVHTAVTVWHLLGAEDLSTMAVGLVSVVGFQVGVALSASLVRSVARSAVRTARAEERIRVREEEALAAERDHERRHADLSRTTIPLLAGLADGALDPRDPAVRRRCAVEAARIRRLLGEGEEVTDRLVHDLGAIIDVAERHGRSVRLSVSGMTRDLPDEVRGDLLAPIAEVLVSTTSDARVTVLYTADQTRVSARCAAPDPPVGKPARTAVSIVDSVSDGQLWLETSWPVGRSPDTAPAASSIR